MNHPGVLGSGAHLVVVPVDLLNLVPAHLNGHVGYPGLVGLPQEQDGEHPSDMPLSIAAHAVVQSLSLPFDGLGRQREDDPQAVQFELILFLPGLSIYGHPLAFWLRVPLFQFCGEGVVGGVELLRPQHLAVLHAVSKLVGCLQIVPVHLKQGGIILLILGKHPVQIPQEAVRVQVVFFEEPEHLHGCLMHTP